MKRSGLPTWNNTTVEDAECKKLYELIWKRTMACQMADAELKKQLRKLISLPIMKN